MFKYKSYSPSLQLKQWIKAIWIIEKTSNIDVLKKTIFPHNEVFLTLVVFENENNVNSIWESGIFISPPSKINYQHNFSCKCYYIDISLKPGVFYKLFGIPVNKLNRTYNIKELSLNLDLSILEQINVVKDNHTKVLSKLNEYLCVLFNNSSLKYDSTLLNILELYDIGHLNKFYDSQNLSTRQLQRIIQEYTGIRVDTHYKISRYYQILKQVKYSNDKPDFSFLASEYNFTDQSHLIKEFKKFSATTPNKFLKNANVYLQYRCNNFC